MQNDVSSHLLIITSFSKKVRYIKCLIYQLTNFYRKLLDLEKALASADLETLNKIIIVAEEKANRMYRYEQTRTS